MSNSVGGGGLSHAKWAPKRCERVGSTCLSGGLFWVVTSMGALGPHVSVNTGLLLMPHLGRNIGQRVPASSMCFQYFVRLTAQP